MEGSTFNPGFLGSHFSWWVGQIVDDVYWRGNQSPQKTKNRQDSPGYGQRYKVRIIGLHDINEDQLPSEKLPWAQIMYPVTAGSGQNFSSQSSNLQQGMFVFGFFLDGIEEQVPVIMGVLGTSVQTDLDKVDSSLRKSISDDQPGNLAIDGSSISKKSRSAKDSQSVKNQKKSAPDECLITEKPTDKEGERESTKKERNKFFDAQGGLKTKNIKFSPQQLKDFLEKKKKLESVKNPQSSEEIFRKALQHVVDMLDSRRDAYKASNGATKRGATIEGVDSMHLLNAQDKKQTRKRKEKIPIVEPTKIEESALKGIQITLDNYSRVINDYIDSINDYADQVSQIVDMTSKAKRDGFTKNIACTIAKFVKIFLDKIMEYVLKMINKGLTQAVSACPSTLRHMMGDMKELITKAIHCLYNKIIDSLCDLIYQMLKHDTDLETVRGEAEAGKGKYKKGECDVSNIPMCKAEELVGRVMYAQKDAINDANDTILDSIQTFLNDVATTMATAGELTDSITSIMDSLSAGIDGNISTALNFSKMLCMIFDCDLEANTGETDYYTFGSGGQGHASDQKPNFQEIEGITGLSEDVMDRTIPDVPNRDKFFTPGPSTPNIDWREKHSNVQNIT